MATRSVATSDSLNTLRTAVNAISGTDIGDLATLTTSAKVLLLQVSMRLILVLLVLVLLCLMDQALNQLLQVIQLHLQVLLVSQDLVSATDTLTISLANDLFLRTFMLMY